MRKTTPAMTRKDAIEIPTVTAITKPTSADPARIPSEMAPTMLENIETTVATKMIRTTRSVPSQI